MSKLKVGKLYVTRGGDKDNIHFVPEVVLLNQAVNIRNSLRLL